MHREGAYYTTFCKGRVYNVMFGTGWRRKILCLAPVKSVKYPFWHLETALNALVGTCKVRKVSSLVRAMPCLAQGGGVQYHLLHRMGVVQCPVWHREEVKISSERACVCMCVCVYVYMYLCMHLCVLCVREREKELLAPAWGCS